MLIKKPLPYDCLWHLKKIHDTHNIHTHTTQTHTTHNTHTHTHTHTHALLPWHGALLNTHQGRKQLQECLSLCKETWRWITAYNIPWCVGVCLAKLHTIISVHVCVCMCSCMVCVSVCTMCMFHDCIMFVFVCLVLHVFVCYV